MLTTKEVNEIYKKAREALNAIIHSRDATDKEQELATEKRTDLTMNFIDKALDNIAAPTAQFQQFIREMEALIAKFDPATTIAGIVQLKDVVVDAAALVLAATTDAPPAGGAAGMHAIASKPGAVPTVKVSAPKGRIAAKPTAKAKARPVSKAAKPGAKGTAKPAKPRSKAKPAAKPPAKKPGAGRKTPGKKAAPAKRAPARRPAAKKPAATKRPAKKPAARKPASRRPK
jgi:hypothetical protein